MVLIGYGGVLNGVIGDIGVVEDIGVIGESKGAKG